MSGWICVMGMHRSGTSCLSGVLQNGGLYLGDVVTSAPHNKKGNRENIRIRELNDSLLILNGGAWDCPVSITEWTNDNLEERQRIIESMEAEADAPWGFKDPRTLLTIKFWQGGSDFSFVGTVRNPIAVAQSLSARNKKSLESALQLWYEYNNRLWELWNDNNFPIIQFGSSEEKYIRNCRAILAHFDLEDAGIEFFDKKLINQTDPEFEINNLPDHIKVLWNNILEISLK